MILNAQILKKLNAIRGAGSEITKDEFNKQAITLVEEEKRVLFTIIPPEKICRGSVLDCGEKASQKFVLYKGTKSIKDISPNLIFPKAGKNELRLYTSEKSFKPPFGSIWYIFIRKDNRLCVGWCDEAEFKVLSSNIGSVLSGTGESNENIRSNIVLKSGEADTNTHNEDSVRQRIERSIRTRRGQTKFRNQLIKRFNGKCCITGSEVLAVLEAAHINTIEGADDNNPDNGLLLRSDIHTLFDLGLLAINPETLRVKIAPELKNTEYEELNNKKLVAKIAEVKFNIEGLRSRWNDLDWTGKT